MSQSLRVLQINIGSLIESDWKNRRHELVAWINKLSPDVICMQEVWQNDTYVNTAGWVAGQLDPHTSPNIDPTMPSRGAEGSDSGTSDSGDWHWAFGGFTLGSLGPDPSLAFGSAVISRWPIDRTAAWRLPVAEGATGSVAIVPWELLHVETAGIDFFSTHLTPAPTDGLHRLEQVQAIDEHIKRIRGERDVHTFRKNRTGMPVVLCGDFNAEPDSDEIRFLTSLTPLKGKTTFYQDAWRVAGGDGPGYTQNWRNNPTSAELNVHRKRIDYVFVGDAFKRDEDAGRVLHAEVTVDTKLTGVMASDHFGVLAEILWPGRPN